MSHLLFVVVAFLVHFTLEATHLVGGEIGYEHLGGNQYRVTLKVYRDCGPANTLGTGFDDQVYIGLWDGVDELEDQDVLTIPLSQSNVSNVPVVLGNPCGTPPPELCIEQAIYSATVNLPPNNYGWDLIWQRCCRNPSISNLQNFGGTENPGATLVTHVPGYNEGTAAYQNSSPTFQALPPVAVCANFDFTWDHSAIDAEGDVLVYALCAPWDGGGTGNGNFDSPVPNPPATPPFNEVEYMPGFSADYPITSNPAMSIDPNSGVISGMPTAPGQYAIGICVSEYRDGILLSTTMRDFQFNVTFCDPNIESVVAQQTAEQLCIGETMTMENQSINGTSYLWDFGVSNSDTDVSEAYEPTFTWPESGDYTVTLIVNPGWPCADTSTAVYQVYSPISAQIEVSGYDCDDGDEFFDFQVNGDLAEESSILWDFGIGTPNLASIPNPQGIFFNNESSWEVVISLNHQGCTSDDTFVWEAPPNPVASVEDQSQFCAGLNFDFINLSTNATDFVWDFGDGFGGVPSGTSLEESPAYTYPDTGVYEVTLLAAADFTCPDVTTATVEVQYLLAPEFNVPTPACFDDHFFTMSGVASVDENTEYAWDFGGATAYTNVTEEHVLGLMYAEPGTYEVSLTATVPNLTGCTQTFTAEVTAIAEPTIAFNGAPLTGCPPHTVSFSNQSTSETPVSYTWHFGDGTMAQNTNTSHLYTLPGSYPVVLEMETMGFCQRSLVLESPQPVEILPVPQAAMQLSDQDLDILNPELWAEYVGDQNVECYYNFGDGNGLEGCFVQYTYEDGGLFTVTQTVINEFGCANTVEGQVSVSGSVFYAPTAFTPDGDGLNDTWLPIAKGISQYALKITNRWGELVFETDDSEMPWLGQKGANGQHFCPNGLYLYKVIYVDQIGYPRVAEGHIHLAR